MKKFTWVFTLCLGLSNFQALASAESGTSSSDASASDKADKIGIYKVLYVRIIGIHDSHNILKRIQEIQSLDKSEATDLFLNALSQQDSPLLSNPLMIRALIANMDLSQGEAALHRATRHGHLESLRFLLDVGVDITAQDQHGHNVVHMAALSANLEVSNFLFARIAENPAHHSLFDAITFSGRSPLHYAAESHNALLINALLNAGTPPIEIDATDLNNRTPLHLAAASRHDSVSTDTISTLLNAGANPNAQDNMGSTPLHNAIESGNLAAVHLIIGAGGSIAQTDQAGMSALHLASTHGHAQICIALVGDTGIDGHGADRELINLRMRDENAAEDADPQDGEGYTALHFAAHLGHVEIIQALVNAGADTELLGCDQQTYGTALHLATYNRNPKAVITLLMLGANPNDFHGYNTSNYMLTALHYADEQLQSTLEELEDEDQNSERINTLIHIINILFTRIDLATTRAVDEDFDDGENIEFDDKENTLVRVYDRALLERLLTVENISHEARKKIQDELERRKKRKGCCKKRGSRGPDETGNDDEHDPSQGGDGGDSNSPSQTDPAKRTKHNAPKRPTPRGGKQQTRGTSSRQKTMTITAKKNIDTLRLIKPSLIKKEPVCTQTKIPSCFSPRLSSNLFAH